MRQDNYVWVLQEPSGKVAIVDPSEAEPVAKRLRELGLTPSYILNTHHHWDHTGAIELPIRTSRTGRPSLDKACPASLQLDPCGSAAQAAHPDTLPMWDDLYAAMSLSCQCSTSRRRVAAIAQAATRI